LNEAIVLSLGNGLDAKAGRVGVRADHGDRVAGSPFLSNSESNECRGISGQVVFSTRLEARRPCISLLSEDQQCIRQSRNHDDLVIMRGSTSTGGHFGGTTYLDWFESSSLESFFGRPDSVKSYTGVSEWD
jgi:hypothetical protein